MKVWKGIKQMFINTKKELILAALFLGLLGPIQQTWAMKLRPESIGIQKQYMHNAFLLKQGAQSAFQKDNYQNFNPIQFDSKELYIFAFDVEQANFIALRKNNKVVIIDAGCGYGQNDSKPRDQIAQIADQLFKGASVEAVFITHPHDDHFSLFCDTKKRKGFLAKYPQQFKSTKFICSGKQEQSYWPAYQVDYTGSSYDQKFVNALLGRDVRYLGNDSLLVTYLDDVIFRVFEVTPPTLTLDKKAKIEEKNRLSLAIQVSANNKKILFLGDAEGEFIDRLKGRSLDLRSFTITDDRDVLALYDKMDQLTEDAIARFDEKKAENVWLSMPDCKLLSEKYWKLYKKFDGLSQLGELIKTPDLNQKLSDCKKQQDNAVEAYNKHDNAKTELLEEKTAIREAREALEDEWEEEVVENSISERENRIAQLKDSEDFSELRQELSELSAAKEKLQDIKDEKKEARQKLKDAPVLLGQAEKEVESAEGNLDGISLAATNAINDLLKVLPEKLQEKFIKETEWDSDSLNTEFWYGDSNSLPVEYIQSMIEIDVFTTYMNALIQRKLFGRSQLIFLPHHGTNSENSQRLLGYFSGLDDEMKVYVVSSSPFGTDGLPKRSTLEMTPLYPTQPEHHFIYSQDGDKNAGSSMRRTNKPIYVTCSAIGGAHYFKIPDRFEDESMYMLNLWSEQPYWFNVLKNSK